MSGCSSMSFTVSADDQQNLCRLSSTMTLCHELQTEINALKKTIENCEDAERDLEMVLDEDEPLRYRCGAGFMSIPFDSAKQRVLGELGEQKRKLKELEQGHSEASTRLAALKRTVGDKFGNAVRLD